MKWFFALDQYSRHFDSYAEMAKVAVLTAKRYTTLDPHCLFDGEADHPLPVWMREHDVQVWTIRTPFYEELKFLAQVKDDPDILSFGAGAFLRMEIPHLFEQQGWSDEFALYTDCDVMFLRDPVPALSQLKPQLFAVSPEGNPHDWENMNSGVMLINVPALTDVDEKLHRFAARGIEGFTNYRNGQAFDQSVFRHFFRPITRRIIASGGKVGFLQSRGYAKVYGRFWIRLIVPFDRPEWEPLPIEFNWKSYWPEGEEKAFIIHFHGPKPNEKRLETSPKSLATHNFPALRELLTQLRNETFYSYCILWQKELGTRP